MNVIVPKAQNTQFINEIEKMKFATTDLNGELEKLTKEE